MQSPQNEEKIIANLFGNQFDKLFTLQNKVLLFVCLQSFFKPTKNSLIMAPINTFFIQPFEPKSFLKRALIGASIAFVIISLFVFGVENPRPEWGTWWMLRPLLLTPFVGAVGGGCTYLVGLLSPKQGWKYVGVLVVSVVGYVISLWLGIVLGLDGTLWN